MFDTTHWSLVLQAGEQDSPVARHALATLCQKYWPPLYAYVRRRVHDPHEAHDLTQEFFVRLLERNYLSAADPQRGRFRSFLFTALQNFLAKEWEKGRALKRGGGKAVLPLDRALCDSRCNLEPARGLTPQQIYDREWAVTLLSCVLETLEAEQVRAGKLAAFEHLKPYLAGATDAATYAATAVGLGVSEAAVKMAVHRLRQRYRKLLRTEIAQTVADPAEVEAEICELFAAFEP